MLTFGILGLVALYVLFHGTNKQQQAEATLTKYWARHPHHTSTGAVADTTHQTTGVEERTAQKYNDAFETNYQAYLRTLGADLPKLPPFAIDDLLRRQYLQNDTGGTIDDSTLSYTDTRLDTRDEYADAVRGNPRDDPCALGLCN